MRRQIFAAALLLAIGACDASNSIAPPPDENFTSAAVSLDTASSDLVHCPEVDRRTTRQDCDDLTEAASKAKQGSAAFNVPPMMRGEATMIQLAISLDPPPIQDYAAADVISNSVDYPMENASSAMEGDSQMNDADATGMTAPVERPEPGPTRAPRPKGPAPAEVVEDLPGETEEYHPLVGRDMYAELAGQGFKIESRSKASQVLSPGSTTTWEWEVTPLPGSNYALTIKTAVEGVMANGERVVLASTVQTRKVDVRIAWYDRVRDALTQAPGWIKLVTAVLAALAALFAAWWTLVRSAKGKAPEDAAKDGEKKDDGARPG